MDKEQKDAIIKLIIEYVDEHSSCRVGWAAEEILKTELLTPDKEKIANTIIQTGEYFKEPAAKSYIDWNILKNPNFGKGQLEVDLAKSTIEANKLIEKNTKHNFWFSMLNILLGLLNLSLLFWQLFKKQ